MFFNRPFIRQIRVFDVYTNKSVGTYAPPMGRSNCILMEKVTRIYVFDYAIGRKRYEF